MTGFKILVTTDGSNLSDKAVETAVELTKKFGGELIGVTAVVAPPSSGGLAGEDQAVRERLEAVARKAREKDVPCEVVAEHCQSISEGILACAARFDAAFIVMASRGLGTIGSFLLGSETQKVLHQADRPVLVVR